jgi:hypothetical protein
MENSDSEMLGKIQPRKTGLRGMDKIDPRVLKLRCEIGLGYNQMERLLVLVSGPLFS